MTPGATRPTLGALLWDELKPYDGRLGMALRMALSCVIVVLVAMSQHVPEAALSCYLIFFASRDNAASGILIAVALIVGASVGILLGLVFLQLAADEPMLRLGLMAIFTFGGMYFSQATKAGPIAATVGFVFAFVMTLYDFVPIPELLSRGISWMWVVVFFPMATLILVNALLGPNPARLAQRGLAERLRLAGRVLRGDPSASADSKRLLAKGSADLAGMARTGALLGYGSKAQAARIGVLLPQSEAVLDAARSAGPDPELAASLGELADGIDRGRPLPSAWRARHAQPMLATLAGQVQALASGWGGRMAPAAEAATEPKAPRDTFTNPAYAQFAFKTLLAVLITYGIYTAWNWFEVHTAMITCFYIALGTTGETLHKAALRIVGCLIGAAMGIGAIVYLMPHMTDIGHLLLLVGAGSFIAAWVSTGSPLIQYAGWQMALAFFLCVLQGFGPGFDIGVATNRVLGILIGNVVVSLVFLSFWPVSVGAGFEKAVRSGLATLRDGLRDPGHSLKTLWAQLAEARRLSMLSSFEVHRLRIRHKALPHAPALLDAIATAAGPIGRLQQVREAPRHLFGAPRCVKAATLAHEASVTAFLDAAGSAIVMAGPQARTSLMTALPTCAHTLDRLETLAARAPRRAAWRRGLEAEIAQHRQLLAGFEQAVEWVR